VTAATACPQLDSGDRDHLDAGLAHFAEGAGVALIGYRDARLQGNGIVGVILLCALPLIIVAAGFHHAQSFTFN
jgi:hypothetical protein